MIITTYQDTTRVQPILKTLNTTKAEFVNSPVLVLLLQRFKSRNIHVANNSGLCINLANIFNLYREGLAGGNLHHLSHFESINLWKSINIRNVRYDNVSQYFIYFFNK